MVSKCLHNMFFNGIILNVSNVRACVKLTKEKSKVHGH